MGELHGIEIKAEARPESKVPKVVVAKVFPGTPAQKAAAEYARDKLKEWSVANARLEPWEFGRGWTLEKQTIEMIEPRYMPLLGYAEAWSSSTAGEIVGTPLMLGGKTAAELEPLRSKIKGAIVMSQPIQTVFEDKDRPQPTTYLYRAPACPRPRPTMW